MLHNIFVQITKLKSQFPFKKGVLTIDGEIFIYGSLLDFLRRGLKLGKVVGFELSSQEPEKATKFYSNVFGWKISEPQWDYWAVSTDKDSEKSEIKGGISKGPNDYPHRTRIQIEVNSIDDAISKSKDNGAMVIRDKMEFDEFFLAYLVDPTGIGYGLIQKSKREEFYIKYPEYLLNI